MSWKKWEQAENNSMDETLQRTLIKKIFSSTSPLPVGSDSTSVLVKGWVRSLRQSKKFSFIVLSDGSCFDELQIVVDSNLKGYHEVTQEAKVGAALAVSGILVESQGKGQAVELQANGIEIIGGVDADYPLQKKGHTLEFLRENAHLRVRTRTLSAVFRVRHAAAMATHKFFHDKGLYYLNSPIITGLDCEGAGEMFQVTTLDVSQGKLPRDESGKVDYGQDYFSIPTYLTVSGQLAAECFALGMGGCYTFGPTFRSENSNTPRHLAEFWMIEPEMAFCDLGELTQLAGEYLRSMICFVLDDCERELAFLHRQYAPHLTEQLYSLLTAKDRIISYTEAVDILLASGEKFTFPVSWGEDLQTEHERYLTEKHFSEPVIVVDYPRDIKAFYMKQNDDGKTVRAMDFLVPGVGELIGGSQREEDGEKLKQRMRELAMREEDYQWYLELRRYGTTPHSGFGLGLERAVMYLTGMNNIRDVVAFPRTPRNARF